MDLAAEEIDLKRNYRALPQPAFKVIDFLLRSFPDGYISALQRLIHPSWYTASFVTNPTNASMWGVYGDAHRGICLKFQSSLNSEGHAELDLYRVNSWRSDGNRTEAMRAYVKHAFYKVDYSVEYPEIDFFRSLGRLPMYKLSGFWYQGEEGKTSSCAPAIFSDQEAWRKNYWVDFQSGLNKKTLEWEHEQEHRLVLSSNIDDFTDLNSRKLQYKFEDLTGIVFGARTSLEDKLKIMRIVENECRDEGRTNFEFFQAQFVRKSRGFQLVRLNLTMP